MRVGRSAISKWQRMTVPTVNLADWLQQHQIPYTENENWYIMHCLLPEHDDGRPSFYLHKRNGGYNCFGCGQKGSWGRLCQIQGWQEPEGDVALVATVPTILLQDYKARLQKAQIQTNNQHPLPAATKLITRFDEGCSAHFQYLESRHIIPAIKTFELSYSNSEENFRDRIIIPVHDEKGELLWPEGRSILPVKKMKYFRPKGVQKSHHLFNLHRACHRQKSFQKVFVVEGVIDAITVHLWGYPVVATFGADLSIHQAELLVRNFSNIVLAFDNDDAGNKALVGAKQMLTGLGIRLYHYQLRRKLDFNDMNKARFEYILREYLKRIY